MNDKRSYFVKMCEQYVRPQIGLERFYEYINWLDGINHKTKQEKRI